MNEFETEALALLRSIDKSLKVLKEAAEQEKDRKRRIMDQSADAIRGSMKKHEK